MTIDTFMNLFTLFWLLFLVTPSFPIYIYLSLFFFFTTPVLAAAPDIFYTPMFSVFQYTQRHFFPPVVFSLPIESIPTYMTIIVLYNFL